MRVFLTLGLAGLIMNLTCTSSLPSFQRSALECSLDALRPSGRGNKYRRFWTRNLITI